VYPSGTYGIEKFLMIRKYVASVTVSSRKKSGPVTPALVNLHQTFMLPKVRRTSRSPNAVILAVNFPRDVQSSLVTETRLTEVAVVFVCHRVNVNSKGVALWQIIFWYEI
jgi:hypothetical protein